MESRSGFLAPSPSFVPWPAPDETSKLIPSRYNIGLGTACRFVTSASTEESMFEVTVEDTFAAGHYLRNYKGKCENPHGHNYKVRVTLAGKELDKAGLLLDFKDLREVMKHVIDRLDHQMINDLEPFTTINPSAE